MRKTRSKNHITPNSLLSALLTYAANITSVSVAKRNLGNASSVTRLMPCFRLAGPMIGCWKKSDRFWFSGRQGGDEDRE